MPVLQKRKKLASAVASVRVTLEGVEVKSQQHLQSIMRAVGVKTLRAPNGNPVFAFDDLKSENKYKPGDPKEQVVSKGKGYLEVPGNQGCAISATRGPRAAG